MRPYWCTGSKNQRIESNNILSWNNSTMDFKKNGAPLRLKGGGESSISNGTSAWGTPQSSNHNNGKLIFKDL